MSDTEQQQTIPEATTAPVAGESNADASPSAADTPATQADLVAAARDAMQAAKAEDTETEAPPAADTTTEPEPSWQRLVREREKGMAERAAAQKAADDVTARARAEADRIVAEAQTKAREVAAKEQQAWLAKYRADPESALRDVGGAEDVANLLVELNTPHGKALAAIRAELAEAKAKAATADDVRKEFESWKEQHAQEKASAEFESAKQRFWTHATKEQTPYLHARYDENEILHRAALVERDWREAGLKFDYSEVAQYLEHEAKKRLSALGINPAQQARAVETGNAPKVSANGSRTITAAAGSERRAAPRPFNELSPEEQKADLLRVAREAYRQHGGKPT